MNCEREGNSAGAHPKKKKSTREDINLRCTCWINRVVLHFMFAECVNNRLQKHVTYVAFICLELEKLEQRVSYQY